MDETDSISIYEQTDKNIDMEAPKQPVFVRSEAQEMFRRYTLIQMCRKHSSISQVDLEKLTTSQLDEILDCARRLSSREIVIIATKLGVRGGAKFFTSRYPGLLDYINPDNIRVVVEDDERAHLMENESSGGMFTSSLPMIILKNIIMNLVGHSLISIENLTKMVDGFNDQTPKDVVNETGASPKSGISKSNMDQLSGLSNEHKRSTESVSNQSQKSDNSYNSQFRPNSVVSNPILLKLGNQYDTDVFKVPENRILRDDLFDDDAYDDSDDDDDKSIDRGYMEENRKVITLEHNTIASPVQNDPIVVVHRKDEDDNMEVVEETNENDVRNNEIHEITSVHSRASVTATNENELKELEFDDAISGRFSDSSTISSFVRVSPANDKNERRMSTNSNDSGGDDVPLEDESKAPTTNKFVLVKKEEENNNIDHGNYRDSGRISVVSENCDIEVSKIFEEADKININERINEDNPLIDLNSYEDLGSSRASSVMSQRSTISRPFSTNSIMSDRSRPSSRLSKKLPTFTDMVPNNIHAEKPKVTNVVDVTNSTDYKYLNSVSQFQRYAALSKQKNNHRNSRKGNNAGNPLLADFT